MRHSDRRWERSIPQGTGGISFGTLHFFGHIAPILPILTNCVSTGLDTILLLYIAMVLMDRAEQARYRHIDEKNGNRA